LFKVRSWRGWPQGSFWHPDFYFVVWVMDMIEIRNLTYNYRGKTPEERPALANIDLDVKRGEFTAVVGPNGSGKSTLAKHLNALLVPTGGQVLVDGMPTSEPEARWQIRQRVGLVLSNPDNQLLAATVAEDVAFGPENLALPAREIRERVAAALELVGMTAYSDFAPHYLSGGQKQRIVLAGILAMKPQYLVLDEPTAMLDPRGKKETLHIIRQLCRGERMGVVYITHSMDEALQADRVVFLSEGRLMLIGTPEEIFSEDALLTTAGLTVPQMAILAARLRGEGFSLPQGIFTVSGMVEALCCLC
jgi:energy-coupling factor transport system ATP-binding protein